MIELHAINLELTARIKSPTSLYWRQSHYLQLMRMSGSTL